MRNLNHNTGTVACLIAGLGTSMFHVLQYAQRLIHQFVALAAVDVYHHTDTARVVFVLLLVKSLTLVLKFTFCHIILYLIFLLSRFWVQR